MARMRAGNLSRLTCGLGNYVICYQKRKLFASIGRQETRKSLARSLLPKRVPPLQRRLPLLPRRVLARALPSIRLLHPCTHLLPVWNQVEVYSVVAVVLDAPIAIDDGDKFSHTLLQL